jgi:hypothetical protein
MKFMAFLMISSAIIAGLFCASIHERVLEKVTNAFNKIIAFLIGAAGTAWVWALLLGTYASRHRGVDDLLGLWASLGVALVVGIVLIGLTTTLADIRENMRRLTTITGDSVIPLLGDIRENGSANTNQKPAAKSVKKKQPNKSVSDSEVSIAAPYPSGPSLTDEEKVQIAKDMVRNAQLKAMTKGVDEESKTDP